MKFKSASIILAALLIAACGREQTNSDGNGPGDADGAGGRQDPPTAPATDLGEPSADSASKSAMTPAQPAEETK